MQLRQAIHSDHAKTLDTEGLRREFLVESIFRPGEITMTYSQIDRIIFGGIMPTKAPIVLSDDLAKSLSASYFLERREMGMINIGGAGVVEIDGKTYEIGSEDALYIGKGARAVSFKSVSADKPAKFYWTCSPAHMTYPTRRITKSEAISAKLGDLATSNARTIYKYIVPDVLETCQLTMGMTRLETGSVWNTMPTHTHDRRMEVYFYFELPDDAAVFHMMGAPTETRHIVVRNEQSVISPSWSIHSGVGTRNYTFIWGMVGENQVFDDMDHVAMKDLK